MNFRWTFINNIQSGSLSGLYSFGSKTVKLDVIPFQGALFVLSAEFVPGKEVMNFKFKRTMTNELCEHDVLTKNPILKQVFFEKGNIL